MNEYTTQEPIASSACQFVALTKKPKASFMRRAKNSIAGSLGNGPNAPKIIQPQRPPMGFTSLPFRPAFNKPTSCVMLIAG